jgi:hypothetical protein
VGSNPTQDMYVWCVYAFILCLSSIPTELSLLDVGPVALFMLEDCNCPLVLFWQLRISYLNARRTADAPELLRSASIS